MLNGFRHGLAPSQLAEVETGFAQNLLEEQQRRHVYLPQTVVPSSAYVSLVFDNNDLNEETLSGRNTTHCTNGITIQRTVQGCEPPPQIAIARKTPLGSGRKKRSLEVDIYMPPDLQVLPRIKCQPIQLSSDVISKALAAIEDRKKLLFLWGCARFKQESLTSKPTVQAWSGFCAHFRKDGSVVRQSNVGYLPVIPASSTESSTVLEILQRATAIADELDQEDIVIVLDQAIYAKALDIVWQPAMSNSFRKLVLRMGAFHVACIFMTVIGKRFQDGGLRDMLTESEVMGIGATQQVLNGKHYNRAVHQLVLHALMRLRMKAFMDS